MDRRGFLKFFAPAIAGVVAVPAIAAELAEELIWTPKKSIFLPPIGGWSNRLLPMSYIVNEALKVMENELVIANRINRQYDSAFASIGNNVIVNVRRPMRYDWQRDMEDFARRIGVVNA